MPGVDAPPGTPLAPEREALGEPDELEEELDELEEEEDELELLFDLHPASSTIVAAIIQQCAKPLDSIMTFSLFGEFYRLYLKLVAIT